jgi:pimeloyl-ACP methyl ester carboxylesterase
MKGRAGVVGRKGLGPLLGRIHEAAPALRIHLLGHSFGARLVSYALAGLPAIPAGGASPVKSLYLLQGAFSHFTFADALPFDRSRKGELAGMASRVDGPLLTTQSLKDLAVGAAYPLASIVARQDNADARDANYRWEAMGHDGAQAVDAVKADLGRPGTAYPFQAGKWLNLDGNRVIVKGGPPSGAHSDILYPQTAWAALAAAGIG